MEELRKRKSEAVVIQLNKVDGLKVLAGSIELHTKPVRPFDEKGIEFLSRLSSVINKDSKSKEFADLVTFFGVEKNVRNMKNKFSPIKNRIVKV